MSSQHFLSLTDFDPSELTGIIRRAAELKHLQVEGVVHQPLNGMTLAMIFGLKSTRTRVAFETGMHQLGGHAIFLSPEDSQVGRGEPLEDTARVLAKMVDIVMIRTLSHDDIVNFAKASSVPVINAMSDRFHPCQLLADMQTYEELRGPIEGRTVAFVGDGYNMCHSYINAAKQFDFRLRIATPLNHQPDDSLLGTTKNVEIVESPHAAVENADLVVTDVWSSMGQEKETAKRMSEFDGYQVNPTLLDLAKDDVLFMHCLPAHRGEEVSEGLLEDPRSVVFTEAGNRLHSQKALLEFLLRRA